MTIRNSYCEDLEPDDSLGVEDLEEEEKTEEEKEEEEGKEEEKFVEKKRKIEKCRPKVHKVWVEKYSRQLKFGPKLIKTVYKMI